MIGKILNGILFGFMAAALAGWVGMNVGALYGAARQGTLIGFIVGAILYVGLRLFLAVSKDDETWAVGE